MVTARQAVILGALGLSGCQPPCGRDLPPVDAGTGPGGGGNLLVVVLDDVGVEQLSAWGPASFPARTPTIDCLCERGLRFTQAWASPACSPSRAELLTGRYNRRLGIGTIFTPSATPFELSTSEDTLPEVVGRAGYATGLFGKWHLTEPTQPGAASHPNRSGFDRFAGSIANINAALAGHEANSYDEWEYIVDGEAQRSTRYPTTQTVDDALDFVGEVGDQPWLVVLSFHAPHIPLHWPPSRLYREAQPALSGDHQQYLAMLEAADAEVGRFLRRLPRADRADTTVVLLSDNGSTLDMIDPALGAVGAKASTQELGVRVPVVVSGPAVRPGVSDALVHLVDVLPTLADIAGAAPEAELDGRSWRPLFTDPSAQVHETIATAKFRPLGLGEPEVLTRAVRSATHKLMVSSTGHETLHRVGPGQLVEGEDRASDPSEADAAQLASLREALSTLDASVAEGWPSDDALE